MRFRFRTKYFPSAQPSSVLRYEYLLGSHRRVGELSKAQWKHVSFDAKTFYISVEHSKNDKARIIYSSDFTLSQFKCLSEYRQSDTWLFTNTKM